GDQLARQLEESGGEHGALPLSRTLPRVNRVASFHANRVSAEGSGAMSDPKATPFLTDIKELQRRAREHVEKGAVTPAYRGDVETAVRLLNEALATEIVCTLRYRRHHYMAAGIHYQAVADEFMEHAQQEQEHADRIAERSRQLGGAPDFNPAGLLTRSHAQYAEGSSLIDLIKEDLIEERIAIESYMEMIRYF